MKKYLIFLLLMAFMAGSIPGALLANELPAADPNALSEVPDETDGDDDDGGSEMIATESEGEGDSGREEDDDDGGSE
jgi:hypothetical protein